MFLSRLPALLLLIGLSLALIGCDLKEATIVYDVDFPRADSDEAQGGGGDDGGSTPGGPVTPTNPNGSGASYTVSKTIANVYEDHSDNDSFTIVLSKAPTADVYVGITNPDTTEVSASPTSVVFGTGNWSTAQTISLIGVEDGIVDGNLATNLTVYIDNSTDSNYNTGIDNATVAVNSIDSSSISAITLTTTGGNSVTESSGTTDTFTVALATRPAQNVTVTLTSADTGEVTVAPSSVVFGTGNFSSAQTITLTAVEDFVVDGNQNVNISANATSTDISYNSIGSTTPVTVVDSGYATPAVITNLSASAGTQLNTLTWSQPSGADNYTLYWSTSSPVTTSSANFTISPSSTLTYTHAGLTAGTTYYYRIAANNTHGAAALSNEVSGTPTAYSGPPVCNTTGTLTDTDPDLLVHYAFSNNLNDIAGSGTTGSPYNLSNTGGTIKYAQSCAYGQAAYFDSSTGYLENSNFNRTNIASLDSGNYTIALWVNRDADMIEYASAISSKDTTNSVSTWGDSIQIDVDESGGNNYMRWNNAPSTGISDQAMITDGTSLTDWSYLTAVHYDNNTAQFYRNGVLVGTHTTFPARWYKMKVGINRGGYVGNQHGLGLAWKGYIDEVKVYNRAFDGDDVTNACLLYDQCATLAPVTPDNLTATAASSSRINLSWNPVNGVTNYTIEWGTSSGSYTGGTINTTNTTYSHTGRSASTAYYYRVRANNSAGSSAYTSEASATTTAANGVTITHSNGSTTVNEAGYGQGFYDWSELSTGNQINLAVTQDPAGNLYVAGGQSGNNASVTKYNSAGTQQWISTVGSTPISHVKDVLVDSSGNSYLITGESNIYVSKFNSSGTNQWTKTYTSPVGSGSNPSVTTSDAPRSAEIFNDVIYINGLTTGTWSGQSKTGNIDSLVLVLDTDGNETSASQAGGSATALMTPSSLAVDSSGNYYQAGSISWTVSTRTLDGQTCPSSACVFVRKFNSSHSLQWTKLYDHTSPAQHGGTIKLNAAENRIYWVVTSSHNTAINGQTNPLEPTSQFTPIVNSLLTSNGDYDWTKWLPYHTDLLAGHNSGGSLAIDGSDNLYILKRVYGATKPSYYGDQGDTQITKLNSSGVEQWSRVTGGDTPSMGGSGETPWGIYSSSGGQLYIVGSSNGYNGKFHGDSISTTTGFLFKADGTHGYMGRDSFTITPTGTQPTSNVTLTLTSSDTSEMIPQIEQGTKTIFANSNWNNALSIYVSAVQDNTTDSNTTPNLTITTSSSDAAWDNLTFTVPVTVVNQTQPGPYVMLGFDNGTITEGNSGSQTRALTAALDRVASSNVTVNLSLNTSGTCTANGSDYSVSSPITINSGQSQATSNVTVYGDTTVEDNETACIDISSVTNATEDGTQQARLTILNDDAAGPVLDNATPSEQQNTVYWQAYSNASSYTLYWKTSSGVSTSDDNITISDNSSTFYVHGGLDNGTRYYYKLVANTASGSSALSNEVSGVPTAYDNCTTSGILADNDTDLLVYYPFNGNLNDEKNSHGDGRYNLTNSGGTIRFPQGCGYGLAGYFNTTSGYAENTQFTDSNVGGALAAGNYTITMWVNADADMPKFASALNTGFKGSTGWQNKSQIDIDGNGRIEWLTKLDDGSEADIVDSSALPLHQWHHLAAVHYDNNTAQLYSNGTLLGTTTPFSAKWYGLVVGLNRSQNIETRTWKGYIDEVKVYKRPFSYNDVIEKCGAYAECLVPPANLAATAAAYRNTLSWTAVNGAASYKIYWDTNANVTTSDSSISVDNNTTSYVHSSLTAGTTYYYRIVTLKSTESALSNEVSGTPPPPPSAVSDLAAASGYQQVKLTWSNVSGADNYTLFWALNHPFTSPFTVSASSNSIAGVSSGYIHGGLTSGKRYEYALRVIDNGVNSALSNQVNGTPTGETTVTLPADNNADLVVYYDFDGDLNNKASTGAAYNLTSAGDAGFVYAGSRFTGDQASYFDSRGGYAYNDNFTDNGSGRVSAYGIPELQDNFTVSMWLRPDEDMPTYASALTSSDGTGGSSSGRFQISDNGSGGIVAITNNRDKWQTNAQLTLNNWSHVVAVKYDNGTLRMYKNGTAGENEVFIATSFNPLVLRPALDSEKSFTTEWRKIKIGINRVSQSPWKGYVDEVKIYKKSLTPTEVGYLYNNHCPKASCP